MNTRKQTFIKKATLVIAIVAIIAIVTVVAITQLVGKDNKKDPVGDIKIAELGYTPTEYVASPGSLSEHKASLYNDGAWNGTQMPVGNYPVSTLEDLIALADIVAHQSVEGSVFYLTADLVLEKENQADRVAIGSDDDASSHFGGTFDGCGFAIENLTGASLFDAVKTSGVVKNLTLKNVEITASAALVGVVNFGEIERVAVVGGTVTSDSDVAGFVNQNYGVIKNSYIKGTQLKSTDGKCSENAFVNSAFLDASLSSCFAADLKNADDEEIISLVGVDANETATLNNSYVVSGETTNISNGIISVADAASGKLAVLLGDAFGQDFVDDSGAAKDSLPVFLLTRELDTHKVNTVTVSMAIGTPAVATLYCNNGYTPNLADFEIEGENLPDFVNCALTLDNKTFATGTPITGDTLLLLKNYIDFSANGQGTAEAPLTVSSLDDMNKLAWAFSKENIYILGAGDNYFHPLADYICIQLGADIAFENTFVQNEDLGEVLSVSDTVEQTTSEYLYDTVNDAWYLATNTSEKISDAELITRLNSLVIKWQPMNFYGEFNGGNYAINNLFVKSNADNAGFFGTFYGTVKNLTINGYVQGKDNVAGVIGYYDSAEYILLDNAGIENVVNNATVVGTNNVGGIIGQITLNTATVNITDCTNGSSENANAGKVVSSNASAGGFVGKVETGTVTISGCTNYAAITTSANNSGGFIGVVNDAATIAIKNSYNYGAVLGASNDGGFIGLIYENAATINISDSENWGTISSRDKDQYVCVGGFVGFIAHNSTSVVTIDNSKNLGTINSTKSSLSGFIGRVAGAATIKIANCVNGSSENANLANIVTTGSSIGAFVADTFNASASIIIENSSNYGKISAKEQVGGFAGYISSNIVIIGCTNNAEITASGCNAAGFVGKYNATDKTITINDSQNRGTITAGTADSTAASGFIALVAAGNTVKIGNSKNYGAVSAPGNAAGFIGYNLSSVTITDSTNDGAVSATGDSAAGFIGYNSSSVTITDSTNDGAVSALKNAAGFIGKNTSSVTITDSTNDGTISITGGATNVAGFVARHSGANLTIENCINSGNVFAVGAGCDAGGFVGYITGTTGDITINNSINKGNIDAGTVMDSSWLGMAGGIIGDTNSHKGNIAINSVENYGTISAPKASGGIIGKTHSATLIICNVLNYGTIVSTGDSGTKKDAPLAGGIIGWIYMQLADLNMHTNIYNSANMGTISIRPVKVGLSNSYAGGIVGCVAKNKSSCHSYFKGDNLINLGAIVNEANEENIAEMIGCTIDSTTITNAFGAEGKLCVASGTLKEGSTYTNYTVKADSTGYEVLGTDESRVDLFASLNNNEYLEYHYWTMSENAIVFEEKKATLVLWDGTEIIIDVDGKSTIADIDTSNAPLQAYKVIIGWILPDGTEVSINDKTLLVRGATYTAIYGPMFEGEGTETNPYLIKNVDDLRNLSKLVNAGLSTPGAYYKQTADITVANFTFATVNDNLYMMVEINQVQYYISIYGDNYNKYVGGTLTPIEEAEYTQVSSVISAMLANSVPSIGNGTHVFNGIYDGDHYTISGLIYEEGQSYGGLFGKAESAILKNINIEKVFFGDDFGSVGTLVGYAKDCQISNCTAKNVSGTLVEAGDFGGIVGFAVNSSVFDCRVNDFDISFDGESLGGIIGYAVSTIIDKCSVDNISLYDPQAGDFGGIISYGAEDITISNCSVNNILVKEAEIDDFGGIIGYEGDNITISNCSVNNILVKEAEIDDFGGIIGYGYGNITISNCDVSEIQVQEVHIDSRFGGIIGYGDENITISNCSAKEIKCVDSTVCTFGGLIGQSCCATVVNSTVKNIELDFVDLNDKQCGCQYIGGIIGSTHGDYTYIIDCTVEGLRFGNVENACDSLYIGGIVAHAAAANTVIEDTSATGVTIVAEAGCAYFGGMIGYTEYNICIKNSYADASIICASSDGSYECGGLVGDAYCNSLTLENSYVILEIVNFAENTYIGGLVATLQAEPSIIKNSYATLTINGTFAESQTGGLFGELDSSDAIIENCFASSNFALEFCGWDTCDNEFSDCANFVVDVNATGGYSVVGNDTTISLLSALNNVAIANSSYKLWTVGKDGATPALRTVTAEISFVDNNGNAIGAYTGIDGKVYISADGAVYYTLDGSIPTLSSNTTYLYGVGGILVESGTTVNAIVLDSHGNPLSKMLSATFSGKQVVITFDGGTTLEGAAPDSIICGVGDVVELPRNLKSTNGATLVGWTTSSDGDVSKLVGAFFCAVLPENGNEITLYPVWDEAGRNVWDGTTINENISCAEDTATGYFVYEINSAADFAGIAEMIRKNSFPTSLSGKNVVLNINVDIDLNNHAWTPIDKNESASHGRIIVNGNGHTIYNLYVPEGTQNGGLFGRFRNLEVDSLNVIGASVYGEKAAGTIIASGNYNISISNSMVQNANIFGGKVANIGGIVGEFHSGTMCLENNAAIGGTLNGGLHVGGLLGHAIYAEVRFDNNFALVAFDGTPTTGLAIGKVSYANIYITSMYASGNFDFIGESLDVDIDMHEVTKLELATDGYRTADMTEDSLIELMNLGARILGDSYMTWKMSAGGVPVVNYALAVGDIDTSESFTDPEEFEEETAFDWYYKHINEDVYYIGTAEEFAAFVALSNISGIDFAGKTIELTADIDISDFNVSPIGAGEDDRKFFKGTFDGAGYTISGIKNALFGTVANVATIKNLTVRGNILNSEYVSAVNGYSGNAAIAISLMGKMSHCVSYVNINVESLASDNTFIGGLVGVSKGGTIENCVNYGTIYGKGQSHIGGILGNATYKTVIDNCQNYGSVTGYDTTYIGGIVGHAQASETVPDPDTETVIKNSDNYGDVTRKGSNSANVGGIIGSADYKVVIEKCNNYGDVLGVVEEYCFIGGVAGFLFRGVSIINCANEGKIVGDTTNSFSHSRVYTGGVVGYAGDDVIIKNCNNNGDVTTTHTPDNVFIGGIVGYMSKGGSIANSNNDGSITAGNANQIYIGGIAGYVDTEVTIENCDNDAAVTATPANYLSTGGVQYIYLSGIVGFAYGDVTIKNSDNSGDLKGYHSDSLFIGGILGFARHENGNVSIEICKNSGSITSTNSTFFIIGGIVGEATGVMLYRSVNEGAITVYVTARNEDGADVRVGGLVGAAYGDERDTATLIESSINFGAISVIGVSVDEDEPSIAISQCGIGGLVGTGAKLIITNSANAGTVSSQLVSGDSLYVAGLLGYGEFFDDYFYEENVYVVIYNCVNFGQSSGEAFIGCASGNNGEAELFECGALEGSGSNENEEFGYGTFVKDNKVAGGYRIAGTNVSLLTALNSGAFNSREEGRMAWTLLNGTLVPSAEFTTYDVTTELSGALTVNKNYVVGKDAASDLAIYMLKFDVGTGNKYPSALIVEIAGTVLDASCYDWNAAYGVLTIYAEAITGDIKVIASSELIEYTAATEVDKAEGGIVSVDAAKEKYGSTINVNCTPDLGYKLAKVEYSTDNGVSWTEIVADENGHYSFKLLCDTKVKATFEKIKYNLTVTIDGEESNKVAVIGEEVSFIAKGESFDVVGGVKQTAIKSLYYIYNGVRHDVFGGVSTGANYTFTMPAADVELYIDFEYESPITTETVISIAEGLVVPKNETENTITVTDFAKNGEIITISANIAKGFKFKNIKIFDANNSVEPLATIDSVTGKFTMPIGAIRIALEVEVETYTLELDLGSLGWTDGYIADIFNGTYTYGQAVAFGVNPAVHQDGTFAVFLNTLSSSGLSTLMRASDDGEGEYATYKMYNFTMPAENATIRIEARTNGSVSILVDSVSDGVIKVYDYTNGVLGNEIYEINSEITQILVVGNMIGYHINSFSVEGGDLVLEVAVRYDPIIINGTTVYGAICDTSGWTSAVDYTISVKTTVGSVTFEGDVDDYTVSSGAEADTSILSGDQLVSGEKITITPNVQTGYKVGFAAYFVSGEADWVTLYAQEDGTYIIDSMPSRNITIKVLIVEDTHDITVLVSNQGAGTVDVVTSAKQDDMVTLTVLPNVGYELVGIRYTTVTNSEGIAIPVDTCVFTMPNEAVTVTVTFAKILHTVDLDIDDEFVDKVLLTINPSAVVDGEVKSLATASYEDRVYILVGAGYKADISVTLLKDSAKNVNLQQGSDGKYYFVMPNEPVNVTVVAEKIEYTIASEIAAGKGEVEFSKKNGDGIWISVGSDTIANVGDILRVEFKPNLGYGIKNWSVNGNVTISSQDKNFVVFTVDADNVICQANFEAITYRLTASHALQYSIAMNNTAKFDELVTVNVQPRDGYRVARLYYTVDGSEYEIAILSGEHTFRMPAGNVIVSATVELVEYTVTFEVGDDAKEMSPILITILNDQITLYPATRLGYMFKNWEVVTSEDTIITAGDTFAQADTLRGIRGDVTLKANWIRCEHLFETVTVAPTCTTQGYTMHTCTVCGATETTKTEPLAHDYETIVDIPATCTTAGSTSKHCKHCESVSDITVIAALGHTFEFTSTVPPSVENKTDGYDLYTCVHGDATEQRNIVEYETLIPPVLTTNVEGVSLNDYVLGTELPVPKVKGCVFEGWYTTPTYQGEAITSIDNLDEDTVLYAKLSSKSGVSGGGAAGIAIGCVVFVLIAAFVALYLVEKKKGPVMSKVFVKVDQLVDKVATKIKKKDESDSSDSGESKQKSKTSNGEEDASKPEDTSVENGMTETDATERTENNTDDNKND